MAARLRGAHSPAAGCPLGPGRQREAEVVSIGQPRRLGQRAPSIPAGNAGGGRLSGVLAVRRHRGHHCPEQDLLPQRRPASKFRSVCGAVFPAGHSLGHGGAFRPSRAGGAVHDGRGEDSLLSAGGAGPVDPGAGPGRCPGRGSPSLSRTVRADLWFFLCPHRGRHHLPHDAKRGRGPPPKLPCRPGEVFGRQARGNAQSGGSASPGLCFRAGAVRVAAAGNVPGGRALPDLGFGPAGQPSRRPAAAAGSGHVFLRAAAFKGVGSHAVPERCIGGAGGGVQRHRPVLRFPAGRQPERFGEGPRPLGTVRGGESPVRRNPAVRPCDPRLPERRRFRGACGAAVGPVSTRGTLRFQGRRAAGKRLGVDGSAPESPAVAAACRQWGGCPR